MNTAKELLDAAERCDLEGDKAMKDSISQETWAQHGKWNAALVAAAYYRCAENLRARAELCR